MKKIIVLIITNLLFTTIGLPAQAAQSEYHATQYDVLTKDELMKGRPANGFRLVYSEDNNVCNPVLDALNEEGYDTRYFNTSDKFENMLSELMIQTRLNAPRTLIGTHLFRTEEYEITGEDGHKEYWYRFIGQGQYLFGRGAGVKKSWMETQGEPFSDFFDFMDKGLPYPDCYYRSRCNDSSLTRLDQRNYWRNKSFDVTQKKNNFKAPRLFLGELITIGTKYYLISTGTRFDTGDTVRIGLTDFNGEKYRRGDAICFFESTFKVTGN